jgi:DNA-binding SARP family transcriptional activator
MNPVEFRVLGPLAASVAGRRLDLGGPRARALLATMLLSAGQIVTIDQLVDALWDECPPPTARTQVKTVVSALRRVFRAHGAGDVIETHPHGYAIGAVEDRLDLNRFESLLRSARAAAERGERREAVRIIEEALDLWHGTPLTGMTGRALEAASARLTHHRLAALEEYSWLRLTEGRYQEVVDTATAVLAEHPVRERFWLLLMHALDNGGDRAGALDAYRTARRRLVENLGVEPGRQLQQLHQAILAGTARALPGPLPGSRPSGGAGPGDPVAGVARPRAAAVSAPTPPDRSEPWPRPNLLPAEPADLVGRTAETDRMLGWLAAAPEVSQRPVVVTGRAGAGKSTLALHSAYRLRDAFPDGQLYVDLHHEADPAQPVDVLGRFLRALGTPVTELPPTLDERAEMYRARLVDRRVLVLLDNAVDEAQVIPLLPGAASCGVVVTSRWRMSSLPGVRTVAVGALELPAARALLATVAGPSRIQADPEGAAELCDLCGYLPLALRAAATRLAARPHWTLDTLVCRVRDEERRLDELAWGHLSTRRAFADGYDALPAAARRLFRLLGAVDSPHTAGWVAAALLGRGAAETDSLLERLVDTHLVDVVPTGPGDPGTDAAEPRFGFHPLVRVYARERARAEETPDALRTALGRALSGWLASAELALASTGDIELHALRHSSGASAPGYDRRFVGGARRWLAAECGGLRSGARQAERLGLFDLARRLAAVADDAVAAVATDDIVH